MWSNIDDAIYAAVQESTDSQFVDQFDPEKFNELLDEMGYMIVPIEDPTNLRFGVEDDGSTD